jgi:molybdenum cofactor guanylyltransferase
MADDIAIVILAGGQATRFPGKLELPVEGQPLLLRVYREARATNWPVVIAVRESLGPKFGDVIDCPVTIDLLPGSGPLGALASACTTLAYPHIFALAADMPYIGSTVLAQIAAAWRPGDEAVIPAHAGGIEPLAALYDRAAVLREASGLLDEEKYAMHALVDRLATRRIELPQRHFLNVNTPADAASLKTFSERTA